MKKRYILAVVLSAMMLSFTVSCSKSEENVPVNPETPDNPINYDNPPGVYNPEKKIKMSRSSESEVDHRRKVWNWNGDLLESIDIYSYNPMTAGYDKTTKSFTYEDNRLVMITYEDNITQWKFEYDGKYLKTAKEYYGEVNTIIYTFSYQDDKLVKIIEEDMYSKEIWNLVWSDNNVIKLVNEHKNWTINFQYDNKNNPKTGFLFYDINNELDDWGFGFGLSKNNVTRTAVEGKASSGNYKYEYQYDKDGYPILQIEREEGDSSWEMRNYFEYE